jgi:glycosyltransferase involved in cell wall biosynthesis
MPLRILFLSDINSAHTRKWVLSLAGKGFTIGLFSLNNNTSDWFRNNKNIQYLSEGTGFDVAGKDEVSKTEYIKALPFLKKTIKSFQPDILHAHYATSYGMLGARSGFHPLIISVWGSDIYEFPAKSFLHKFLLKRNLSKADYIWSTSHVMAKETSKYTSKNISVTPFGIDLNKFKQMKVKSLFNDGDVVVGTIKSLENDYRIDILISAFDILCKKHPELPLKLLIVGGGSKEAQLKEMCVEKGIMDKVKFTGLVKAEEVPVYQNMIDVYIALSDKESFGVAAIEASACAKPVVVSDARGFTEVVENNVSGIIVPRGDATAAANAIEKIVLDKQLAASLGNGGRARVEKLYNWELNLDDIVKIYNSIAKPKTA